MSNYRVQVTIVEKGEVTINYPDGKSGGDYQRAISVVNTMHHAHVQNTGTRVTDITGGFLSNLGDRGMVIQIVEVEA